jgi:hypothetical protein
MPVGEASCKTVTVRPPATGAGRVGGVRTGVTGRLTA